MNQPRQASSNATSTITTSERIKAHTESKKAYIAGQVISDTIDGRLTGHPNRSWTSLNPNEAYLNDLSSGYFGKLDVLKKLLWDKEAHDEALATFAAYVRGPRPWKGMRYKGQVWVEDTTEGGHWEALQAPQQQSVEEPLPLAACESVSSPRASEATNKKLINAAYQRYAADPENELSNLQAAVFAFAPMRGRLKACKNLLLSNREGYREPDDIIMDFTLYVLQEIAKGKYHAETYEFHSWIAFLWSNRFLPDLKKTYFSEINLTEKVYLETGDDADIEEAENRLLTRFKVESVLARRSAVPVNDPSRLAVRIDHECEKPDGVYSALSPATRMLLNYLKLGMTTGEIARIEKVSSRTVLRWMETAQQKAKRLLLSDSVALRFSDDVVKGGRLYTVRIEDFELEVAR